MKKTTNQQPVQHKTGTIIVLVICGLIFLGMVFWLYSEDILQGRSEIFSPYSDEEVVEWDRATVTALTTKETREDEYAEGMEIGTQELTVIMKSGRYKGETMTAYNYYGPLYGVPVEVGDSVMLTVKTHPGGEHSATVYEFNRIPIIAAFALLFFIVVVLVGGRTGFKSMISLIITFVCLFMILIPLLIKGAPTVLTTFLTCTYIALVSFTILGGIHRKTISAFLGTIAGALLAMVFGLVVQNLAKINGYRLDDAEPLLQLRYVGAIVRIRGLLTAGIIISALGAVMDVAMSISSALEEVHAANPSYSSRQLFRSGMNIGRDMVGTMTNTLILAFLGGEFSLMIFLFARDLTFNHLGATAFVALETISALSSSIGMVLAIPLTAMISATLITSERKKKKRK